MRNSTTGNIDIAAIAAAITPQTRAIAVVHYLGVPVDMPQVVAIARRHNLFLLEDCALAPGAKVDGVHVGSVGRCRGVLLLPSQTHDHR
jgi:perosamine synthetase